MRNVLFKICLSNKTNNAFTTDITTKDFCFADNYDVQQNLEWKILGRFLNVKRKKKDRG